MSGKILADAAEIIVSAGAQIEALVDKLEDAMKKMLENQGNGVRVSNKLDEDKNGWLTTQWLICFSLREKRRGKSKEHAHVAVHLVLYDETFVNLQGWEPAIFVIYCPGEDEFFLDGLKNIVKSDEICRSDQRFWRWAEVSESEKDSWMFSLPLVSINSEDDIQKMLVDPVRSLLSISSGSEAVFPDGSRLFKFKWEGDTFSMS